MKNFILEVEGKPPSVDFLEAIDEKFSNGTQSVRFSGIYRISYLDYPIEKVKVSLKRDSYDFQSYAQISVWTKKKWSYVTSLAWEKTETKGIFYQKNALSLNYQEKEMIRQDTYELIDLAAKIIF